MRLLLPIMLACVFAGTANAEAPRVVASILPIHSIVSSVMEGVGEPTLLVPPGASPHDFAMRPSKAEALSKADLVVWVGPKLSSFLAKPLGTLATDASVLTLMDVSDINLLPVREGGSFEGHAHGHGHDHGSTHQNEEPETHEDKHEGDDHKGHDQKGHDSHGRPNDGDGHGSANIRPEEPEPHIWLETANAQVMAHAIAMRLSQMDPNNAARYSQNATAFARRMDDLGNRLNKMLRPTTGKPFVVFHDAWQHFERQFGLTAVGSITINPEQRPGARHISRLRSRISDLGAVCVFSEPQFDDRLVDTLTRGTEARRAQADPLGSLIAKPGIGYFEASLSEAAEAFRTCLAN
jgi:zinc transport system substrate-binding protein